MMFSRKKFEAAAAALLCFWLGAAAARAVAPPLETPPSPIREAHFVNDVCRVIRQQSERHALPAAFFARLIWKESRFDPNAVSPKGAQGIAQFMPETAEANGLRDPFVPHEAIEASARLLARLRGDFGNLGLAAAAYNAGPERVASWLAGASELPLETEDYVAFITGREAQEWSERGASFLIPAIGKDADFAAACIKLALRQKSLARRGSRKSGGKTLGFEIAAGYSARAKANRKSLPQLVGRRGPLVLRTANLTMRARKSIIIRVGAGGRADARALCAKLRAPGRACTVTKH